MANEIEAMYHMSQMMAQNAQIHAAMAAATAPGYMRGHPPTESDMQYRIAHHQRAMEYNNQMMKYGPERMKPPDDRVPPAPPPPPHHIGERGPSMHPAAPPGLPPDHMVHHRDRVVDRPPPPLERIVPAAPPHHPSSMDRNHPPGMEHGPHRERAMPPRGMDNRGGMPVDNRGLFVDSRRMPMDNRRIPVDGRGVPMERGVHVDGRGPPVDSRGIPMDTRGIPIDQRGIPVDQRALHDSRHRPSERAIIVDPRGVPVDTRNIPPERSHSAEMKGARLDNRGRALDNREILIESRGVPVDNRGVPVDSRGVPMDNRGLPMDTRHKQDIRGSLQLTVDTRGSHSSVERTAMPPPHYGRVPGRDRIERPNEHVDRGYQKESRAPDMPRHSPKERVYPERYPAPAEVQFSKESPNPPTSMERVPAPVPYQALDTQDIVAQPQREVTTVVSDNPNKRKHTADGGEQPLDLTVKKSKQELVCTNPFEVEYTPSNQSKPPPQVSPVGMEFGPNNPDVSYPPGPIPASAAQSHSSQSPASHINIPADAYYRRQGASLRAGQAEFNSNRPPPGPWVGPVPPSQVAQQPSPQRIGKQNVNPALNSTMVARPPERLGEQFNKQMPGSRDNSPQHAGHQHPRQPALHTAPQQQSHPSQQGQPHYPRDSNQPPAHHRDESMRPQENSPNSSHQQTQRMEQRSDSNDASVSRNHYRPPSMLQYQRRSSWSSSTSSLNNSMEKDGNPHHRPPEQQNTAKPPAEKKVEENRKPYPNENPNQQPVGRHRSKSNDPGESERSFAGQNQAPVRNMRDPSPNQRPMNHGDTVSPHMREQNSPALSRNHSPASSDQGYHRSGRSSAHSSDNYSGIHDRNPHPEGQPHQSSRPYSHEPAQQDYSRHYGNSSERPEYNLDRSQHSTAAHSAGRHYDGNKTHPPPQHPSPHSNRGNMYGNNDYDKYRQWRQEQKSMAAAAHAAQYPSENRYQRQPHEKPPSNTETRSKNTYNDVDQRNKQTHNRTPKQQDSSKESVPKSNNRPSSRDAVSTDNAYDKTICADNTKSQASTKPSQFPDSVSKDFNKAFAKNIENAAGKKSGVSAKDLVDVPLSLFYLPYYPMGLTEKLAKMDEEKAREELAAQFPDEQSIEMLKKKFPDFPHDIPKNSEIFRKLPNGVRFHRTQDLPGSREAVTRSLPVANVNPIIKAADGKDGSSSKMSVSDIIAAKISEGLPPPPSNQQSIQEPQRDDKPGSPKAGKAESNRTNEQNEDCKQSWQHVNDIASLFFPFHVVRKKNDKDQQTKVETEGKKSGSHTNLAKYIESAIAKNLKLEDTGRAQKQPDDVSVDLTKDEEEPKESIKKGDETSEAPTNVKKAPEATVSRPPSPKKEEKKDDDNDDDKNDCATEVSTSEKQPDEAVSRCQTPDNKAPSADSKPSGYKSRKHYFLHRHLAATQDEDPGSPAPKESSEANVTDPKPEKEKDTQANADESQDTAKKDVPAQEDEKKMETDEKIDKTAVEEKKESSNAETFENDQYKLDRNIPKYPDTDSNDTWPAKSPSHVSASNKSPDFTPLDSPRSPTQSPSSPAKPEEVSIPKNDQGRRRGRGRGRGGRRPGMRGRPPKVRPLKDDSQEEKQDTQPKNGEAGFGQGTSTKVGLGPGTSKPGFCPTKTKLLRRLANKDIMKERTGEGRTVARRMGPRRSQKRHDMHDEISKHPLTRTPRRLGDPSKRKTRKRASSPARLKSVLRNKRKRISYNKNAAYEEAIRKEEERRLKQLQMRAKELVRDQKKVLIPGVDDGDSGEETEIDEAAAMREAEEELRRQEQRENPDSVPRPTTMASADTLDAEEDVSQDSTPEKRRLVVCRETGETALHKAARKGYLDLVKIEITNCDVNGCDNAGYTPLHEACMNGHMAVASFLMENGADLKCVSYDGTRPLHDAIIGNHIEVVRLLLHSGADPSICMYSGKSPIDLARTPEMKAFLKGYLIDMNGTKERSSKLVINEDGIEEEKQDEDFSHEIPWPSPPSFLAKDGQVKSGYDATTPPVSSHAYEASPEFELFENVPLPLFNINADIQKGWRNFHLLKDVTRHVGVSRDAFLTRHPHLMYITRSKHEMIVLIKNGGSLNKKDSLAYLEERCKGDKTTLVELDNDLRKVLGGEICKVDPQRLKGKGPEAGTTDKDHKSVLEKSATKSTKSSTDLNEDGKDVEKDTEAPTENTNETMEENVTAKAVPKQMDPNMPCPRFAREQYSPPNTRRLQAIKQQPYSFRRGRKKEDLTKGARLSRSSERDKPVKNHAYRAHRSNSPKAKAPYDPSKKCELSRSHSDRSMSPASARSDSPSRSKPKTSSILQDISVSFIEGKLSTCNLSEDGKENITSNRGVFAIRTYLKTIMKTTPRNRDKTVRVKGVPTKIKLRDSKMDKRIVRCSVKLLREDSLSSDASYIIPDEKEKEESKPPTFKLRKSTLECAVKRFTKRLRKHLQTIQIVQDTHQSTNQTKQEIKTESDGKTENNDGGTESEIKSDELMNKPIRTRSNSNTITGEQRRRTKGVEPILPILERQRTEGESVIDEDEMPSLTCAFAGQ